jgi:pimeloyl-ACP methyl ester carboxylesterase
LRHILATIRRKWDRKRKGGDPAAHGSIARRQAERGAAHANSGTFVLIHGAWQGGWCYAETARILRSRGHTVFNPSLTGLGDRRHLLGPAVKLTTHILDVVNLVEAEHLRDIILVGHSYAGNVVAAASERIRSRILAMVYLDCHVPADDDKFISVVGSEVREQIQAQFDAGVYGIGPSLGLVERFQWGAYLHRLTPHPAGTFLERVPICGTWKEIPHKTFVVARESDERATYERLKSSPGWRTEVYDGNHMIMIDDPEICADVLERAIPQIL